MEYSREEASKKTEGRRLKWMLESARTLCRIARAKKGETAHF